MADLHHSAIGSSITFTFRSLCLRISFLGRRFTLSLFFLLGLLRDSGLLFGFTFFSNLGSLLLVVEITDSILELKLPVILDFERTLHLVAELHRAEVEISKW